MAAQTSVLLRMDDVVSSPVFNLNLGVLSTCVSHQAER
jgi:hypothetical protein